ncbi:MAG: GNAT family N-acetyltransferase [Stappia sp.]|uniref:GNAT family N-acetyltransferase n=1 Tax=Stappia sp. TaxID=1870903 RepID=UPI000C4797EE|nr:GNAT family N-acetyltransferase [Stappia sp.]MAB00666.1 GNAT family N-acetyltransferase [Stappia sp.]MBM18736.1 GNAT family N-acetyltransferase [Stappia sp.]|tara:strand:+ start:156 stop:458 length:303 start_codon:yes stop_codon:yes gene_type:complete
MSAADITITRETSETRGRYIARVTGHDETGKLTFSISSATLVIADHTGVPDVFRGMGVGLALVERLVADAREQGFKIMPLCPFVNAQRKRHPEWADVFSV